MRPAGAPPAAPSAEPPIVPRPAGAPFDARALALARAAAPALGWPSLPGCRVLVVPHHDLAAPLIAAGLDAAIDEDDPPGRIVLVGVDHARTSSRTAATSARRWMLPGEVTSAGAERRDRAADDVLVAVDGAAVRRLIGSRRAGEDAPLLAREHSIAGLVPFVAAAAPGAALVPLAVRPNAGRGDIEALAEAIDASMGPGHAPPSPPTSPSSTRAAGDPAPRAAGTVLVVAAVDFAHGLAPARTAANGGAAAAALAALDLDAVGRWDDAFADGRGALRLAMTLARRAGAARWTMLAVTDSRSLPDWAGGEVTGYVAGCWGR